MYDAYQAQVDQCDAEIEKVLLRLSIDRKVPDAPLPEPKHRTKQPNCVNFDVRKHLYQIVGTDLTQIHGIDPYLALRLVSECGTNMSR